MIRTRFAPSPTGYLHVGGLRTALYNYLFARKNGGTFILRIEDTDQNRYVEGALESLLKTLEWVGLEYNEGPHQGEFGPYIQSERTELYRKYAQELLDKGYAYLCFCTPERLEEMRQKQSAAKLAPMYDRTCLKLSPEEIEKKKQAGLPYVIRQKIPRQETIMFEDLIRGRVKFEGKTIDDQVLMKSDHFPTYHLANVVDDHLMQISHVIRGEEWLPSTPKHLFLYQAFGWTPPQFAHLPLLLNKDKSKLSKRQGDVSVEDYIKKGYSKEAIINFIVLLGWHPGGGEEQEIFSLEELIEKFSLDKIHKAGAIFDLEKLNWFNFQWNRRKFMEKLTEEAKKIDPESTVSLNEKKETVFNFSSPEKQSRFTRIRGELLQQLIGELPKEWLAHGEKLLRALTTIEEKILKNPREASSDLAFYFEPKPFALEPFINPKMKVDQSIAAQSLEAVIEVLKDLEDFSQDSVKNKLMEVVQKLGLKNGQVFWPVRVALTHEQFSPGVFEVIWALEKEETLKRLQADLENLK